MAVATVAMAVATLATLATTALEMAWGALAFCTPFSWTQTPFCTPCPSLTLHWRT